MNISGWFVFDFVPQKIQQEGDSEINPAGRWFQFNKWADEQDLWTNLTSICQSMRIYTTLTGANIEMRSSYDRSKRTRISYEYISGLFAHNCHACVVHFSQSIVPLINLICFIRPLVGCVQLRWWRSYWLNWFIRPKYARTWSTLVVE